MGRRQGIKVPKACVRLPGCCLTLLAGSETASAESVCLCKYIVPANLAISQIWIPASLCLLFIFSLLLVVSFLRGRRSFRLLREGRQRLQLAMDGGDLGIWDYHIPTKHAHYDKRCAQILGYGSDEMTVTCEFVQEHVHPDDLPAVKETLESHLAGKTPRYQAEYRIRTKDGHWIWTLCRGRVIERDAGGHPIRLCGIQVDISTRKEWEMLLLRYEKIFSSTSDLMAYTDTDFIYLTVNEAYAGFFNKNPEDIIGYSVREVVGDEAFDGIIRPHLEQCLRGNEVAYEKWFTFPNGEQKYMRAQYYPSYVNDRIVGVAACIHDLTAIKSAIHALEESEEKFRSLVEASSDWIWALDANSAFTYCSPQIRDILGYEPEIMLGKTIFEFMATDEAERVLAICKTYIHKKVPVKNLINTLLHQDGHEVIIETCSIPIIDKNGDLAGCRGVNRDVTDRIRAVESLQKRTEELERFERLAIGRELEMIELKKQLREKTQKTQEDPIPLLGIEDEAVIRKVPGKISHE